MHKAINKDTSTLAPGLERLERAIAHQGLASRREAKDMITRGLVKVNKKVVTEPGFGVRLGKDNIDISQKEISDKESVLVYKPRGIETSATTKGTKDIHSVFSQFAHLSPIGRLDKDSEGLIILSNDGTLTSALTKIGTTVGKTYLVSTREAISSIVLQKMATGIILDKVLTKPAETKRVSRTSFTITLHEGRKHQIRRMCDACRLTITALIRIEIGSLVVGKLKSGMSRKLNNEEIVSLKVSDNILIK